jgi:integrase
MTTSKVARHQHSGNPDQYLKKRGDTWSVSVRVPRTLEKQVGSTHIRRSLKTRDKVEANRLKHAMVGQIKAELEQMRRGGEAGALLTRDHSMTFAAAKEFREAIIEAQKVDDDGHSIETLELVASDKAEQIEQLYGLARAKRWYNAATRTSATLSELMDQWLDANDYRESTNLGHRKALGELLEFVKDPEAHPEDITRKLAILYIETDLTQRDLHHSTVGDKLRSLAAFWGWIASRGIGIRKESNPWTGHKISKAKNKGTTEAKRAYTDEELVALLKGTEKARKWPTWSYLPDLIVLGLFTGCREEELCSLTADRVDLKRNHAILTITDAKTKAGNRPVAVTHPAALVVIKRRLKGATGGKDDGRLFPELERGGADKRFSSSAVKAFVRYRRECGVPDGTDFHSLRRCVCTILENAEVSPVNIARFVGHKVGTMAADVYSAGGNAERAIQTAKKVCYPRKVDAAALALVHHQHGHH